MDDLLLTLYCPTCAGSRPAECPPCPDGHGDACPDRACVECGTALLLDAPLVELARVDTDRVDTGHVDIAPRRRRAA